MPTLTVHLADNSLSVPFDRGPSLRRILESADVHVRAACKGTGVCGMCRVTIEQGAPAAPTSNEQYQLGSAHLDAGVRLACQVWPETDLELSLESPPPDSPWRILTQRPYPPLFHDHTEDMVVGGMCAPEIANPYGVIVDIGTTTISVALLDLARREWLGGRTGRNPQAFCGIDVLSRLMAAAASPEDAATLSRVVLEAIGAALLDIAVREGLNLGQVVRCVLAGNTAMLSLLSGKNSHLLLRLDHWTTPVDCDPDSTASWREAWGVHEQATVRVLAPLGGFIGSDLLAGMVAVQLVTDHKPGLFIDFGTNTEIALWDGGQLWVTSAAGGPAFEGCGLSCGSQAEAGAIYRVRPTPGETGLTYATIHDGQPRGICGSGLVDLLACLRNSGELTATGRFAPEVPAGGFPIAGLRLSVRDVDLLQRAKAAIGAGVAILLKHAGLAVTDLTRVFCAGAFGEYLDVVHAQRIGLLPSCLPVIVTACGNSSLGGCEAVLCSSGAANLLDRLRRDARLINLSACADFEPLFFDNLYLDPLTVE